MSLQRIHDVHRSDGLPLAMLAVRDRVSDERFEEGLEHAACLFVDQPGDAFYTTSTSETSDRRLRHAKNVVAENFAMTLRTTFAKSLAAFAFSASSHVRLLIRLVELD